MAVEEQLRFSSPVQALYRTALTDYTVGNVTIPAGDRVMLSFGAANRDPLAFENPDEFQVRRNPKDHIAFGFGPHFARCPTDQDGGARHPSRTGEAHQSNRSVGETVWTTNSTLRGPARLQRPLGTGVVGVAVTARSPDGLPAPAAAPSTARAACCAPPCHWR